MKKINICLYGDYYNDDRIVKKATSLSKQNKVKVIVITKNQNRKKNDEINKNLIIENIILDRKLYYLIKYFNKLFWKRIVKNNFAEIYDCNDPETIYAGVYAKKIHNSKIIYDSHELWFDCGQKKDNLLKTIYSQITTKILYLFYEKKNIIKFDKVIVVCDDIKKELENKYNLKNISVIYNYAHYDKKNNYKKNNYIVFIGAIYRAGLEELLIKIKNKTSLKPIVIGFKGKYKEIEYKGFLNKKEYIKLLKMSKIGIYSSKIDCKNVFYAMPNKIFQYIQAEVPIIGMDVSGTEFIKKNKIGELYSINNDNDLINKINKILKNYDYYINNIKKVKYNLSWEAQEKKLLKIYCDLK